MALKKKSQLKTVNKAQGEWLSLWSCNTPVSCMGGLAALCWSWYFTVSLCNTFSHIRSSTDSCFHSLTAKRQTDWCGGGLFFCPCCLKLWKGKKTSRGFLTHFMAWAWLWALSPLPPPAASSWPQPSCKNCAVWRSGSSSAGKRAAGNKQEH